MENFPTELGILTCLGVFAASMWIPYIYGANVSPAKNTDFSRPTDPAVHPAWTHRAYRAHLNLLEQLVPFALLVLLVDRVDGFTALTYWTAIAFFWLRVTHAVGMITGATAFPLRPIIFTAGWVCCLIMAYAVFAGRM